MIVGLRHTERSGCLVGTDSGAPFLEAGRAPCVLAFHGFTGTTSELRPMLERLSDRGYAVHAPLLPGHGSSPALLQHATFDVWVSAMKRELVAARRRHGRVVLCGFSLGSLVALELAAEDPEGLVGVVLLGNAVRLSAPLRVVLGSIARTSWTLPDWYMLKLWSADIRDRRQRGRIASYDRDPLRAALEVYRAGRRVETRLPYVRSPALILHGGKDRVCPPSNVRLVATRLGTKDVETRIYPESAHLVAADVDREDVADEVIRFVDRIERTSIEPQEHE